MHNMRGVRRVGFLFGIGVVLVLLAYQDRSGHIPMILSKNCTTTNLLSETKSYTGKYLVFNPKCQIPEMRVWSLQILSTVKQSKVHKRCTLDSTVKINGTIKGLTYVKKQLLVTNESALAPLGLRIKDIECCYQVVENAEDQNVTHYDYWKTYDFGFSKECYPMAEETQPISSFIRVRCSRQTGNESHQLPIKIHTEFHLVAVLPNETNNDNPNDKLLRKKLEYWKERSRTSNDLLPPSVLVIGVDSTSRLHFRRILPGVVSLLKNDLQAVELKGYTKVGINSFPNIIPFFTSFSVEEMNSTCWPMNMNAPMDTCKFIWKNYSDQNYLTALIEDNPNSNSFMGGFAKKPTDIFTKSWILAAYKYNEQSNCLGYQRSDQVLLAYIKDLVGLSVSRRIPFYIFSWFSDYSHDRQFDTRVMDAPLTDAILKMKTSGWLDNTVLIVMSDHGRRYPAEIRHTLTGWYEDKLPALWIKVGKNVKKGKEWVKGLRQNSNQLVTVFDIHETMKNVLKSELNLASQSKERPFRGVTLFQKVPDRSCDEAGIPLQFCACTGPEEFKGSNKMIEQATRAYIDEIQIKLGSSTYRHCNRERIKAYSVTGRAILPKAPVPKYIFSDEYVGNVSVIQEQDISDGNVDLICGVNVDLYSWTVQLEVIVGFNVSTAKFYPRDAFVISWSQKISQCLNYIEV